LYLVYFAIVFTPLLVITIAIVLTVLSTFLPFAITWTAKLPSWVVPIITQGDGLAILFLMYSALPILALSLKLSLIR
jgi:hypothetical protein